MTDRTKSVTLSRDEAQLAIDAIASMDAEIPTESAEALAAVAECLQGLLDGFTQITLSEEADNG